MDEKVLERIVVNATFIAMRARVAGTTDLERGIYSSVFNDILTLIDEIERLESEVTCLKTQNGWCNDA